MKLNQKKTITTSLLAIHLAILTLAQLPGEELDLPHGQFHVGFKNYTKQDNSRSYKRLYDWDNSVFARLMSISQWYPGKKMSVGCKLKVNDYMTILKQEEEWESLPNDRILSWFYYADNERNKKQLGLETKAFKCSTRQGKISSSYLCSKLSGILCGEFCNV